MSETTDFEANPAIPADAKIGVDVEGRAAWWEGAFHGDPEVVAAAQYACTIGRDLNVGFRTIVARADTPDGATAALFAFKPGRTRIDVAPGGMGEWLSEG